MAKLTNSALRKKAKANTVVKRTHSDNSVEEVNGVSLDATSKHPVPSSGGVVGMALGITKNMGDFESLRVDTWLSLPCDDTDSIQETYSKIHEIVSSVLEETVSEYTEE